MKRLLLLVSCAALLLSGEAAGAPTVLELQGIAAVDGLQIEDVDADGIADLLVLQGRDLSVWTGRKGALPREKAVWGRTLPASVSYVDAIQGGAPAVFTVGTEDVRVVPLDREKPVRDTQRHATPLAWHDSEGAVFADLRRPAGLLLPHADGWSLVPDEGLPVRLRLTPFLDVRPPGPFLEDTCTVVRALPEVFVGVGPLSGSKDSALWAIDGRSLVAQTQDARVAYDLSFLSAESNAEFDQTLLDLDGDGRPDLLHRIHTNRETRYGFFRTKPAVAAGPRGPTHKPAASALFLSGFQLEPDFVDLDGDGLKDLVVTSMQVNAPNMLGALTSGRVTAETRAFLNRWAADKGTFFDAKPDAVVKSQIGVKVQFNYAGSIEVVRSFTILLDGDFDGDGRMDLAIRTAPDELTIHRGVKTGVWAEDKAALTLKIPSKGRHPDIDGSTADIDGDGKDEIILVYRKPPGGRDRVRIVDPGF